MCLGLNVTAVFQPQNKILFISQLLFLAIESLSHTLNFFLQNCVSKFLEILEFLEIWNSQNCDEKKSELWDEKSDCVIKSKWTLAPYLIFDTNENKAVTERSRPTVCLMEWTFKNILIL